MTKEDISDLTRVALGDRVRAAVKAVLEQVIEEEMTEYVGARHREQVDGRMGERNGSYQRSLITPVGKIEQLRVPRDREGTFTTEVLARKTCFTRSTTARRVKWKMHCWRCGFKASVSGK